MVCSETKYKQSWGIGRAAKEQELAQQFTWALPYPVTGGRYSRWVPEADPG